MAKLVPDANMDLMLTEEATADFICVLLCSTIHRDRGVYDLYAGQDCDNAWRWKRGPHDPEWGDQWRGDLTDGCPIRGFYYE